MADYALLPSNEHETICKSSHCSRSVRLWKVISLVELFALVIAGLWFIRHEDDKYPTIYSPVGHLTKYENVVFTRNLHEYRTEYQGFSAETDAKWLELYIDGIVALTQEEADKLPNRTSSIPGKPGMHIATFPIFHHLHCLNSLRKSLYREHYGVDLSNSNSSMLEHLDHCVDTIRQGVMCSPDISTIVWQYDNSLQRQAVALDVVQSCRNFNAIKEWAAGRVLREFDYHQRQPGDPEIGV